MINSINIRNFKNIVNESLTFDSGINVIVGANGQGKTSLFEAIHTLIYVKSFNELRDRNLQNFEVDESYYFIKGNYGNNDDTISIYYDKKEQKKVIEKNGVKITKFSSYLGDIDAVVFVQNDIDIIDDAEYRKKYFNRVISALSPIYIDYYHKYATVLKEKSALLKKDGRLNENDKKLYKIYNAQLAKLSFQLGMYKKQAFTYIQESVIKSKKLFIGFDSFEVRYKTPETLDEWDAKFTDAAEKELTSRRISEGVHRENFDILFEGKHVNKFYSEGQKKMFSVLLKHAEYYLLEEHKESKPILIFDDVYSKLDKKNIELVEAMINSVEGQVLVSFIEEYSCDHYDYNKKILVKNGGFYDT